MNQSIARMKSKRLSRELEHWLLPPGFQQLARRLIRPPKSAPRELRARVRENVKFRDIHKGERCFILASGPSIAKQNLKPLKDELCIAVSCFHLHENIREIAPQYHVLAPMHLPFDFDKIKIEFDRFVEVYPESVAYFLGHRPYEFSYWEFLKRHPQYRLRNIHFLDYSKGRSLDESNFNAPRLWDIADSPFSPRTVIYSALEVAAYIGFAEIVLLGCDHDYLSDFNRVTDHHFYAEEKGFSDVGNLERFDSEHWFYEYHCRWRDFRLMRQGLEAAGRRVVNATDGGYLDVFPRASLGELLSEK